MGGPGGRAVRLYRCSTGSPTRPVPPTRLATEAVRSPNWSTSMSNPLGNIKHGGHGTLTYARWKSMMQRCHDSNSDSYKHYGGAGVTVCERWRDFASFLTDMGECPNKSLTLDRIEGHKGYEPGNCRWATRAEQNRNRPSHAVMLTHGGASKSLTDWAREIGLTPNTLRMRLQNGWSVEKALTTAKQPGRFQKR